MPKPTTQADQGSRFVLDSAEGIRVFDADGKPIEFPAAKDEPTNYTIDQTGHEHAPAGTPEGGQFTSKGGGSGGGSAPGKVKKTSSPRLATGLLKSVGEIKFSDQPATATVGPRDYDQIEAAMTLAEQTDMDERIADAEHEAQVDAMENFESQLTRREIAEANGQDWGDIRERIGELIAEHGGDQAERLQAELATTPEDRPRRIFYGSNAVDQLTTPLTNTPPALSGALGRLGEESEAAIDEAFSEAEQREREAAAEDTDLVDTGQLRREWLREFYDEHPERFESEIAENVWTPNRDGEDVLKFKVADKPYTVRAYYNQKIDGQSIPDLQFSDSEGRFSVTGGGHAFSVFSKVVPAMVAYLQKKDLAGATFSAAEKSRGKVYDRLVRTVASAVPGYVAVAVDAHGKRLYAVVKEKYKDKLATMAKSLGREPADLEPLANYADQPPAKVTVLGGPDEGWFNAEGWGESKAPANYAFEEHKHPRGQPENAGQFAKGGGMGMHAPDPNGAGKTAAVAHKGGSDRINLAALAAEHATAKKERIGDTYSTPVDLAVSQFITGALDSIAALGQLFQDSPEEAGESVVAEAGEFPELWENFNLPKEMATEVIPDLIGAGSHASHLGEEAAGAAEGIAAISAGAFHHFITEQLPPLQKAIGDFKQWAAKRYGPRSTGFIMGFGGLVAAVGRYSVPSLNFLPGLALVGALPAVALCEAAKQLPTGGGNSLLDRAAAMVNTINESASQSPYMGPVYRKTGALVKKTAKFSERINEATSHVIGKAWEKSGQAFGKLGQLASQYHDQAVGYADPGDGAEEAGWEPLTAHQQMQMGIALAQFMLQSYAQSLKGSEALYGLIQDGPPAQPMPTLAMPSSDQFRG